MSETIWTFPCLPDCHCKCGIPLKAHKPSYKAEICGHADGCRNLEERTKTAPKPEPKVGEWRIVHDAHCHCPVDLCNGSNLGCVRQVYRSTGWSADQRVGKPWVMKSGDVVTRTDIYTVRLVKQLNGDIWEYDQPHDGSFKYEPIDRRKTK